MIVQSPKICYDKGERMTTENLQRHPAFFAGLQIELKEDRDNLIFDNEHRVSAEAYKASRKGMGMSPH